MKAKHEREIQMLGSVLQQLPEGHAFDPARRHIRMALQEIQNVESKRARSSASEVTPAQKWEFTLKDGLRYNSTLPLDRGKKALNALENMIGEQQKIIDGANKGDDNVATILG